MKREKEEGMRNRTTKMRMILIRSVVTLLFLGCVMYIWHNSMESAVVSSGRSGRITEVVNEILQQSGIGMVTEHFIRKLAHFSEYGMEGVLTVGMFVVYCLKPTKRWKQIAMTGLLTAVVDESIQFFSAGRSPEIGDVCIDMAGFICGMLFMLAAYLLIGKAAWKTWFQNRNRKKSFVS